MLKNSAHILILLFVLLSMGGFGQNSHHICGQVKDEKGNPLPLAYITLQSPEKIAVTDMQGYFCIRDLSPGVYRLHISFLGYNCIHECQADVSEGDAWLDLIMYPEPKHLSGVEVRARALAGESVIAGIPTQSMQRAQLIHHQQGSLAKSLEYIPGFKAMEIGQGLSKPVIRGLGFDRVVVTDQGVKQEGQQWGADHGLEIDQFGVEEAEVVKGPMSLLAGSDAIGGAILLKPVSVPAEGTFLGDLAFTGYSVNDYGAVSIGLKGNHRGWFSHLRTSLISYADYRMPADSFYYNNFRLPVYKRRLKNTAGWERDISLGTGFITPSSLSRITYAEYHAKAGFFPGSHGIPTLNKIQPDSSYRNIELPFQEVIHRKALLSHTRFFENYKVGVIAGYQDNLRQEWSKFHTHYPNQQAPAHNPDLELQMNLKTLSLSADVEPMGDKGWQTGVQFQHQWHVTGGYMFLLAPYQRTQAGVYGLHRGTISGGLTWSYGLRYDYGYMHIDSVFSVYANRLKSREIRNFYHSLSFSAGLEWNATEHTRLTVSMSKGFRLPSAMELSANGIHHGSFRYELGDPYLKPENMYQLDAGLMYQQGMVSFQFTPFMAFSPDFIFLTPTGSYNLPDGTPVAEADAGQVFIYRQAHALRAGGELLLQVFWPSGIVINFSADYIYATDFDYPLPFTPPLSSRLYLGRIFKLQAGNFTLGSTLHAAAAQHRVARNEPQTPGYITQDINFVWNKSRYQVMLQALNIWNRKYFNHIAFYRIIELPEAGRNIRLSLIVNI